MVFALYKELHFELDSLKALAEIRLTDTYPKPRPQKDPLCSCLISEAQTSSCALSIPTQTAVSRRECLARTL